MKRTPNLFLIGAQKAGSSSLHMLLKQHPQIACAPRKELNIFNHDDDDVIRKRISDIGFPDGEFKYYLDSSVNYSRYPKSPSSAHNIKRFVGDKVNFIYLIRDPVERMISNHYWKKDRYGGASSIDDAIHIDDQLVWSSRYDVQIKEYLKFFEINIFKVLIFEEFFKSPQNAMNGLTNWLQIEPLTLASETPRKGATRKSATRNLKLGRIGEAVFSQSWLRSIVKSALSEKQVKRLMRVATTETAREPVSEAQKKALFDRYFRDSVDETERLTGLDLGHWKR